MPQKNPSSRRLIAPLALFTLAGWALWALGRNEPADETSPRIDANRRPEPEAIRAPARAKSTWSKRRLATSLAFVTLFFAGAAFSAGAGNVVAGALEGDTTSEVTSTEAEEQAAPAEEQPAEEQPTDEQPAEEQPAADPAGEQSGEQPAAGGAEDQDGQGGESQPAQGDDQGSGGSDNPVGSDGEPASGDGTDDGPASGGADEPSASPGDEGDAPLPNLPEGGDSSSDSEPPSEPAILRDGPHGPAALDPEADAENFFATVWLHRTLPDPTPPAKRLSPLFAKTLLRESQRDHLDWAVVLGTLRANGFTGSTAPTFYVRRTADRLAGLGARRDAWRALLAYRGRTAFADRALALTRYNRAVGLSALVSGLVAAKPALQQKVLHDTRLNIYPAGRLDVALGRIDVRVLVLMEYLAESHREVTVSSLLSGHRLYARPGVVSAHVYGLAVDISALSGTPIAGHQNAHGLTEQAVRNILLLPAELQPRQVISLLGLGGPSFPLANHWDHIHVGY
jgi:hypothetical protein